MLAPSILVLGGARPQTVSAAVNLGDQAQLLEGVARLRAKMPEARLVGVASSLRERTEGDVPLSHTVIAYLSGRGNGPFRLLPMPVTRLMRCALLLLNARRIATGRPSVLLSNLGRSALRELQAADALFMSGAGALNDRYATSIGGLWCLLIRVMSTLGKPVVASGQQVGPLSRFHPRLIVRWGLRTIDALGVREPKSFECAVQLGVPRERIVLTGDDAWNLQPAPAAVARSILARHGLDGPFIAAQVRFGPSTGWRAEDAFRIGAAFSRVGEDLGLPVLFVPLSHSIGNEEQEAAENVSKHMRERSVVVTEHLDAPTTKAVLGEAFLGVGTSYHFCVFAASMGTPVIGMHSSPYMRHKIEGLAALERELVVAFPRRRALRPESLLDMVHELLDPHAMLDVEPVMFEGPLARDEAIDRLRTILETTPRQAHSWVEGAELGGRNFSKW
jgi:polysaccharide pyruvyl transferase WcaK-like protein